MFFKWVETTNQKIFDEDSDLLEPLRRMQQKPSNKKIAGQASRSFATKSRPGDLGQMGDHFGETWPKIFPFLSEKYNEFK